VTWDGDVVSCLFQVGAQADVAAGLPRGLTAEAKQASNYLITALKSQNAHPENHRDAARMGLSLISAAMGLAV
jgi:hypothetical protein